MSCSAPALDVDILDERAFSSLHLEWTALLDRAQDNRIFHTPDWYRLWWRHFGVGSAQIFTKRGDDGRLQGVLPLRLTEVGGVRTLSFAGDYNVADYLDAIVEREGAVHILSHLWEVALCETGWDRIDLRHVPGSSPTFAALHQALLAEGLVPEIVRDTVCPVALLCSNWDGYLQMLTKKQRHEIRRKVRRAQEGTSWDWRTAASHEDIDAMLPTFHRLQELSGRDKAQFLTEPMRSFFRDLAHEWLDRDVLRLSLFRRDGLDLAATISFLYRDRYLLYNSGYDPEYAQYSPGIAAVALSMQDAIEHEAGAFDFLSGDEPYKYQFGATDTYTCRLMAAR